MIPPAASEPAGLATTAEFRRRWSSTHGGLEPARGSVVDRWLRVAEALARPLAARGVTPDTVTAAGVGVAALAAVAAGRRPGLAGAGVIASAVLDGLDGTVAVLTGTAGRRGFLLDSLADRASDALLLVALRRVGAHEPVVAAAAGATVALEYARARAAAAGFEGIGLVTVGERPTRMIIAASGLLTAVLFPARRGQVADLAAAAVTGLAGVGAAQFVRTALPALAAPDPAGD